MRGKRRRIVAALVLGGLVLATGWGLWTVRPILAPFLLAVVVAYLISPLVNALARRGMSRGWAILLVYLALALIGGFVIWKVLPQILGETQRLAEAIPYYSLRARNAVDGLQQRVREMGLPPELRDVLDRTITDMEVASVGALQGLFAMETLERAAGLLASLLLAPFLAFYLLKDIDRFKERFVQSLPSRYRMEILGLLRGLDRVLAGFVRGQVLLAVIVGLLAGVVTSVLGLRYAVLLGVWAGIMEFIPYVGPVLGAIPAVISGFSISPLRALEAAIAFAVIQQIENAVLAPKVLGESVGLHPMVVLLAVMAGGYVAGTWGLILALPVAGVARVLWCFLVARLTEAPPDFALVAPAARPEPRGEREKV